ncbi:phospholipase A1 PLIP2, chloroplastic-like [Andrographis paniculata]|uniref:phospholipase A1 PLIP2, chloroplastic-like n=1 Tax=Andrographis paniculata TaxID=175694 RepID=UPI0021E7EE5D|nr:phospholipase A1 PLIP2, chloroplastic-like [Andrographis paniculata]
MDALCLKAGIHGMVAPQIAASGSSELRLSDKPSVSAVKRRNLPWGFTFRHPLGSLWPGGKSRYEPAIAVDDSVLVEEKEDAAESAEESRNENWVLKILHVKSLWKEEAVNEPESTKEIGAKLEGEINDDGGEDDCCAVENDGDCDCDGDEQIQFDRESFSKLLRKVPLAEARLYSRMSYLGNLAYAIPEIKPSNLLRNHGLRLVTSSVQKREAAAEKEKSEGRTEADVAEAENAVAGNETVISETDNGRHISAAAAYHIVASAASYLHSHTRTIFRSKSSGSIPNEINGAAADSDDMINQDVASLMATTDSVTAVVAAKEEVKQAVADDLNSTHSSPCEWFVCDDDQTATRLFVVQGSESLASWQANLLFEPIEFEGLDVLVHRGIYEAAKGIYEQMLPEIRAHVKTHGERATFRFTGHSLGGSLSLLVSLMLLIRGEAPRSSLLPVVTFGAPTIMCGGNRLLHKLGLPKSHVRSITMHRDIVPRAFSCHYPIHVAEFLKAINGNFRNLRCLSKQKLLYAPMGEFLILQPDDTYSPNHNLLPSGSGLYVMTGAETEAAKAEKQIQAAQAVFMNSPHPLEILSDRSAYGSGGTIQRDHDMNSYLKSVRNVIRHELNRIRKSKRERRRKVWWPLVAPRGGAANSGGIIFRRPATLSEKEKMMVQGQLDFSGMVQTGRESLKRFTRLIASQHMHLLVVLLFPAKLLVLGTFSLIKIH